MLIRTLFSIPDGEKVTEKALRKVLISSICAILLCMTCLVSTTWAWFAVSIENTGNVIQLGEPKIKLMVSDDYREREVLLGTGTHTVIIEHANEVDDLQRKSTLYVTLTLESDTAIVTEYTTLGQEDPEYKKEITINAETEVTLRWTVSWFAPANAVALTDNAMALTAPKPTKPSAEPATETATEPTSELTAERTTEPSFAPTSEATTTPAEQ